MTGPTPRTCTAFDGSRKIASGPVRDVAARVKGHLTKHPDAEVLIFDDLTSQVLEFDWRGNVDAVLRRIDAQEPPKPAEEEPKRGPGRPRLGVVAREVTLLPQHWDWLASQPGGASVTLRKLVEEARKKNAARDRARQAQDAAYKFMTTMAGDRPHYEDALRALYAKDAATFAQLIAAWPKDIREHVARLAAPAL